jgi:hypothetical protein
MSAVREAWTDERLDDLSTRIDRGFDRVDRDIRGLRVEVKAQGEDLRHEIGGQGRELRGEIGELRTEINARFDAMYRTMVYGGCGILGAVVASIAATLLT